VIEKIISSGLTGPEKAALDAALKYGVPHGGWIHFIHSEERNKLRETYNLELIPALDPRAAIRQNISDADGTLLLTAGRPTGDADYARHLTLKRGLQMLGLDMGQYAHIEAGSLIASWMELHHVRRVYVTGTGDDAAGRAYHQSRKIIEAAITIYYAKPHSRKASPPADSRRSVDGRKNWPASVDQAVKQLLDDLFLRDRTRISTMEPLNLDELHPTLGQYIRETYGLLSGNHALLKSCMNVTHAREMVPDEASAIIIKELWKALQQTHRLRIVPPVTS
jgi:hypothetical protein